MWQRPICAEVASPEAVQQRAGATKKVKTVVKRNNPVTLPGRLFRRRNLAGQTRLNYGKRNQ